ncbi:MAG: hypothetical protein RIT16_596 [Actinomycetota bacterium]
MGYASMGRYPLTTVDAWPHSPERALPARAQPHLRAQVRVPKLCVATRP